MVGREFVKWTSLFGSPPWRVWELHHTQASEWIKSEAVPEGRPSGDDSGAAGALGTLSFSRFLPTNKIFTLTVWLTNVVLQKKCIQSF